MSPVVVGSFMQIIWSTKYLLSDYIQAPKTPGVYLVGLHIPGHQHNDDEYLGVNFPHEFIPKYVGISKRSMRSRLYRHYSKRGNRYIREHILIQGDADLEFVYCSTDGTEIEHHFLENTMDQFTWNVKQSESVAWVKYLRSL